MLYSSLLYHKHFTELFCLMEGNRKEEISEAVTLFAFAQICRGIWEPTWTTQELNVLVTVPGGPWWDSCSHRKAGSAEQNAGFCRSTLKRNNILIICTIGVILPKWTMIYIFHVRTGFLRGWLIVLVWNNSSGNLFQNWLIHTLHGLSWGFFFFRFVW